MSLLSTRQTESSALINEWAREATEKQCPLGKHEYCASSERHKPRKSDTVRHKQSRSSNRKANRNHKHYHKFEHPYDDVTMRAESIQITDYARAVIKKPKKPKWVKRKPKDI